MKNNKKGNFFLTLLPIQEGCGLVSSIKSNMFIIQFQHKIHTLPWGDIKNLNPPLQIFKFLSKAFLLIGTLVTLLPMQWLGWTFSRTLSIFYDILDHEFNPFKVKAKEGNSSMKTIHTRTVRVRWILDNGDHLYSIYHEDSFLDIYEILPPLCGTFY